MIEFNLDKPVLPDELNLIGALHIRGDLGPGISDGMVLVDIVLAGLMDISTGLKQRKEVSIDLLDYPRPLVGTVLSTGNVVVSFNDAVTTFSCGEVLEQETRDAARRLLNVLPEEMCSRMETLTRLAEWLRDGDRWEST